MAPNNVLKNYVGLGTQLIAGLIITLYFGKKLDEFMQWKQLLIWILPSVFILFVLIKIIKDTNPK